MDNIKVLQNKIDKLLTTIQDIDRLLYLSRYSRQGNIRKLRQTAKRLKGKYLKLRSRLTSMYYANSNPDQPAIQFISEVDINRIKFTIVSK